VLLRHASTRDPTVTVVGWQVGYRLQWAGSVLTASVFAARSGAGAFCCSTRIRVVRDLAVVQRRSILLALNLVLINLI